MSKEKFLKFKWKIRNFIGKAKPIRFIFALIRDKVTLLSLSGYIAWGLTDTCDESIQTFMSTTFISKYINKYLNIHFSLKIARCIFWFVVCISLYYCITLFWSFLTRLCKKEIKDILDIYYKFFPSKKKGIETSQHIDYLNYDEAILLIEQSTYGMHQVHNHGRSYSITPQLIELNPSMKVSIRILYDMIFQEFYGSEKYLKSKISIDKLKLEKFLRDKEIKMQTSPHDFVKR